MTNRYLYPRGFEDINPDTAGPAVTRGIGDREVDTLFKAFINGESEIKTWDFHSAVMVCAKRLFGTNLAVWILNQKESEYVGIDARNYLIDTVNYFKTGSRHMHPRNWVDLIVADPQAIAHIPVYPKFPTYAEMSDLQDSYLSSWLRHPDGIGDLVFALFICFGSGLSKKQRLANAEPFSPKNPKLSGLVNSITKSLL